MCRITQRVPKSIPHSSVLYSTRFIIRAIVKKIWCAIRVVKWQRFVIVTVLHLVIGAQLIFISLLLNYFQRFLFSWQRSTVERENILNVAQRPAPTFFFILNAVYNKFIIIVLRLSFGARPRRRREVLDALTALSDWLNAHVISMKRRLRVGVGGVGGVATSALCSIDAPLGSAGIKFPALYTRRSRGALNSYCRYYEVARQNIAPGRIIDNALLVAWKAHRHTTHGDTSTVLCLTSASSFN